MIKIDDTPVIFIPFMDRCHDKYFFKTHNSDSNDPEGGGGGDSHMEGTGMLVGNFEFNP